MDTVFDLDDTTGIPGDNKLRPGIFDMIHFPVQEFHGILIPDNIIDTCAAATPNQRAIDKRFGWRRKREAVQLHAAPAQPRHVRAPADHEQAQPSSAERAPEAVKQHRDRQRPRVHAPHSHPGAVLSRLPPRRSGADPQRG